MGKDTILVIDDEQDIQELLNFNLLREGYSVLCASTGEKALEIINSQMPSLIILDLMLPGMDGLEVCKILKGNPKTEQIPVIMLSAKGEEADIVTGLELGAEDYVTKPFSPKILVSRVRRILRKKVEHDLDITSINVHELSIYPARCEVTINGKPLKLTLTEFNILYQLAKRPGVVFTRYQIVDAVHGGDYIVSDRAVDVQIAYLRKKMGTYKRYIETVRGVGYRFKD